jgi:hypothetical protein
MVVAFDQPLQQAGAVLWISFQYSLKEGLSGFYRQAAAMAAGAGAAAHAAECEISMDSMCNLLCV